METKTYHSDLRNRLGRGSFGSVYEGSKKDNTNFKVAIKEIENDQSDSGHFSGSAKKEFYALQRVCGHINIVELLDFDVTRRYIYIIMEFCDMGDLECYLKKNKLKLEQKLKIMKDCAEGINYLHDLSPPVIHRDIKPGNILMKQTPDGSIAKIGDFGLAKVFEDERSVFMSTDAGTPMFRAPELLKQGRLRYTASVDVFALGLVYLVMYKYDGVNCTSFEPYNNPSEPYLIYGTKLLLCEQENKPMPVLLNITSNDSEVNITIKALIMKMILFDDKKRINVSCTVLELDIARGVMGRNYPVSDNQLRRRKESEIASLNEQLAQLEPQKNAKIAPLRKENDLLSKENADLKRLVNEEQPKTIRNEEVTEPGDEDFAIFTAWDKHVVVAAFDMSLATKCAYALSFRRNPDELHINRNWGECIGRQTYTTPCSILTGPNEKFLSFGYEAEKRYTEAQESEEECVYEFYEHINKLLHRDQHVSRRTHVTSVNGHICLALDIFVMAIRYLKDHLLDVINKSVENRFGEDMVRWVITIPDLCTEGTKQFIREAAFKAGCMDTMNSRQLGILTSSKAAAYGCRNVQVEQCHVSEGVKQLEFTPGIMFLLVNATDERYEMSVHKVSQNGSLQQLHVASGAGNKPEEMFVTLLKKVFGQMFIDAFKEQYLDQWLIILHDFQTRKKNVKSDVNASIHIPWSFGSKYSQMCNESVEEAIKRRADLGVRFTNGVLLISSETMLSLFEPVIPQITSHMKEVLSLPQIQPVSYVFLVGELGKCVFIREAVQDNIPPGVGFLVPSDAEIAVVKGAVMYGHKK